MKTTHRDEKRNGMGTGWILWCIAVLILSGNPLLSAADTTNVEKQIERPVHKAISIQQETNRSESAWRNEKQQQIALLESLEKEKTVLETEKATLIQNNAELNRRIRTKQQQLADMEQISSQILPYLYEVMAQLKTLQEQDAPFLVAERKNRIQNLETMLPDPDITVSEKFRKIMEALTVEAEYGKTIETYQETIPLPEGRTLVNIFRLGRVSLFYQTLDKQQCGVFNAAQAAWERLPDQYRNDIQVAIDIAAKRRPVELLDLPIGRITAK